MPVDLEESIRNKLQRHFESSLANAPCLTSGHYIAPLASSRNDGSESYPIIERLSQDILNPQHHSFLLLGDSGLGKTTFGLGLCDHVWCEMERFQRVPLYIHLPQYVDEETKRLSTSLLDDYLSRICDERERIGVRTQPLLLILDGYDEITDRRNIYSMNRWGSAGYDIKVVVACRGEVLRDCNRGALFEVSGSYQTYYLQAFNKEQIDAYLCAYTGSLPPEVIERYRDRDSRWINGPEIYRDWLNRLPALKKLAETPFLLTLIVKTLPLMIERHQGRGDAISQSSLTQTDVFEAFTQDWFREQARRLERSGHLTFLNHQQRCDYLSSYAQNLAVRLINPDGTMSQALLDDRMTLDPALLEPVHYPNPKDAALLEPVHYPELLKEYTTTHRQEFTSTPAHIKSIRSGCLFNTQGGKFRFLHKSLVEFLAARKLFSELQSTYDLHLNAVASSVGENRQVIRDIQVINRLAERIKTDRAFEALLWKIIEASKTTPGLGIMAANAITWLNAAQVDFGGRDLSDVQIPGADLRYALCWGTRFNGANLRGVNFSHAWLPDAQITGADCEELEFGEQPYLKHPSLVNAVTSYTTPEASYWLVGCEDGYVYQWDSRTQQQTRTYNHGRKVFSDSIGVASLAVASSGTDEPILATGGGLLVWLWSLRTGSHLRKLAGHTKGITSVAASPDGRLVASGSRDKTVRLWCISDGSSGPVLLRHSNFVTSVSFSSTGEWLASASGNESRVRLWSVSDGRAGPVLLGHSAFVMSVSFSPTGEWVASGSQDRTIRLWRVSDGSPGLVLSGHSNWVTSVSFSPTGEWVASGSWDNTVRLWRVCDGSSGPVLSGHSEYVISVSFSSTGEWLASGSEDNTVRLWRVSDGRAEPVLSRHSGDVRSVSFSPTGEWLASGSNDKTVHLWRVSDGRAGPVLSGHSRFVSSVSFSPTGEWVASGSVDNTVRLWRVSDGSAGTVLSRDSAFVSSVSFSPTGEWLASGSWDCTVRLWHVSDGRAGPVLSGHSRFVNSVSFSPTGEWLASGSNDKTVRLWRVCDGSSGPVLSGHSADVTSVSFSSTGEWVASGSRDNTVRLWRVCDGSSGLVLSGHSGSVRSVSFSSTGEWLASGSDDQTVRLWRMPSGQCLKVIPLWYEIYSLSFTSQGNSLAIAGENGNLVLLDINTHDNNLIIRQRWLHQPRILNLQNLNVTQAIGLPDIATRLCEQRGARGRAAPEKQCYIAWCSLFQPIPGTAGVLQWSILNMDGRQYLSIRDKKWVVSMARKKGRSGLFGSFFARSSNDASNHVFLLIEGVKQNRRFVIHADLTTPGNGQVCINASPWFQPDGRRAITDFTPAKYVYQQWSISADKGNQLLKNIRADQQQTLAYRAKSLSGGLGTDYQNCVTWAKAKLQQIGIAFSEDASNWSDGLFVNPTIVVPDPDAAASSSEKNGLGGCGSC